jgi:hypothetical protein
VAGIWRRRNENGVKRKRASAAKADGASRHIEMAAKINAAIRAARGIEMASMYQ